jgi:pyruvate formate lyase activating enzyme
MFANATGAVFHIMRFSLHDGPGIRTAVFFKGCPLSCWWCHNPESQSPLPQVMFTPERCCRCGSCIDACPERAHDPAPWSPADPAPRVLAADCRLCGGCAEACPAEARRLAGRTMKASEILAEIERDTVFYDESSGGVTFTGGEPLGQPIIVETLLEACRKRRIHTAIETCGAVPRATILRAGRLADLILYDLKLIDEAKHRHYTGAGNRNILSNLEALLGAGARVTVRIPIVPGVNDTVADVAAFRSYLKRLPPHGLELLPYHATGADKYRRLDMPYRLADVQPPTEQHLQNIRAALAG